MVFRRSRPQQPAYAAGLASSSTARFHDDASPTFKANVLVFSIGCALAGLTGVVPSPVLAAEPAGSASGRDYAISAGRLSDVLAEFAATSGVQLVFDPKILAGLRSNGLQGRYSVRAGFSHLLAGSGYETVDTGNGRYSLQQVITENDDHLKTLPTVNVTASTEHHPSALPKPYAGGKVARGGRVGMLGNKDMMDTPFNQTNYTREFVQDVQARTLTDVMYNDPSVAIDNPRASSWEATVIRGFSTGDNTGSVALNGLYGILPSDGTGVGMAERVEVLKGPSALLNGMPTTDAVGGSVNLVGKRARYGDPFAQLAVSYASQSQPGVTADVGSRFGPDQAFGIRFNGNWRDGGHSVEPTEEKFLTGTLGLDYEGERFRVSADFGHQDRDISAANRPLFLGAGVPVPELPDNDKSYLPPWTLADSGDTFGMIKGEWDVTDDVMVYAAYGMRSSESESLFINPSVTNVAGDWSATPSHQKSEKEAHSAMIGINWKLVTGPIHHALAVNAAGISEDTQRNQTSGTIATRVNSNLYNPVFPRAPDLPIKPLVPSLEYERTSVGIADTLSIFDERLQITAGVRHQSVANKSFNINTGLVTADYESDVWSPAYTLLVKPLNNVSVYGNYIEGLRPGTVVGDQYANAREVFPPYQSVQYEAGIKVDWSGNLMTSLSAFQIAQPNTVTIPGTPLPTLALDGEQRNRGLEFNVFGQPWEGIRLTGGAMIIDAALSKTQGGLTDGNQAPAVPEWQGTLGAEWDVGFLPGLTLTTRLKHSDKAYIETSNVRSVPSWTLWDVGARYHFNTPWDKPAVLRLTIENVTNENFWTARTFGVYQSTPRTALLSATFDF
jgi:iron complex outermembrane receptor protein